ncbi:glyoxalase superfamily protein [Cerasicoccus fimbriatus]|uniref:glyoxalase superfamily protein n=1 Tax=Cerasicoccus fimbriatus TaxID=3014554 RepID=UPI0022B2ED67|nr:glyoxalase superfamily protein [Cerasicoccus sp. TK19100]
MILATIPVIRVKDAPTAEAFYCGKLGFTKQWEFIPGDKPNPAYLGLQRDNRWVYVSSFTGDGIVGSVVNFVVDNVDALYEEFKEHNVAFALEPFDQSWGNREMYLDDPDGNKLRFIQES